MLHADLKEPEYLVASRLLSKAERQERKDHQPASKELACEGKINIITQVTTLSRKQTGGVLIFIDSSPFFRKCCWN